MSTGNSRFAQAGRSIKISTPLKDDALVVSRFTGKEEVSRLFRFELDLRSEHSSLSARDLVGKNVTVSMRDLDGSDRHFNGFINRFSYHGTDDRSTRYSAEMVPWTWFLTQSSDCLIFQGKTVPEIVEEVFLKHGFTAFEIQNLKEEHRPWEYCVQYRETAFNFVSRLMEHEGIFYFFRHEQGRHVMVLGDQNAAFRFGENREVMYAAPDGSPDSRDDLHSWEHRYEYRPGRWVQTDYNFESPSEDLRSDAPTTVSLEKNSNYEMYDFPGEYAQKATGMRDCQYRMEEDEASHDVVVGSGKCRKFVAGEKFTLTAHRSAQEAGKSYVLTAVEHQVSLAGSVVAGVQADDVDYSNKFWCIPEDTSFRPQRITPKPSVQGTQTAVVVGPKGGEVNTDQYGRIRVRFHWYRTEVEGQEQSCWIRVAQVAAGKRWGASFWPRVGQEVVVSFLEGDPNRPLVVGSVYNAEQRPPYLGDGLDSKHKNDNKVTGFKTNSTQGGEGYNELRFDDNAGKEEVFLHAQRNLEQRVLNDSLERVLGARHLIVGKEKKGDQHELVEGNKHEWVKGNRVAKVEGDQELTVGKGEGGGGNQSLLVEKDKKELVEGSVHLQVKGTSARKVDGDEAATTGGNLQRKVDQSLKLNVKEDVHVVVGKTLVFDAKTQISFRVGGNFVDISAAGVAVNGVMVLINSGGVPGVAVEASPKEPEEPVEAKPEEPAKANDSKSGFKSSKGD